MTDTAPIRIGTRGSPLALVQARMVESALHQQGHDCEIVAIKTTGDQIQDRTLMEAGGKGLFTKELDEAQLDRRVDIAVHSMKDVPTWLPHGLTLNAMLPRADPRDAWLSRDGKSLDDLPAGAVVGTASLRRGAQIKHRRPDVTVIPIRGNVDTRLGKLRDGEVDATLLACAGLDRLGRAETVPHERIEPEVLLPAVAQGAVGITCREGDSVTIDKLAPLHCPVTGLRVAAERAMLEVLDGSCHTPIAALAVLDGEELRLSGLVIRPDGSEQIAGYEAGAAAEAQAIGAELGRRIKKDMPAGFMVE